MGHAIFISYRRDDTEGEAGRLFDDLARTFGDNCVFMDVAGITPGMDFRKAIEDNVAGCGVLLAMIGPSWVTIKDAAGNARLADPNDFVRVEIASALKRNVAVIPVLVHDAKMPRPESVPEDLKDLCFRNSVEISHARWNSDVALLVGALKSYVTTSPVSEQHPVHATVSVQLPAPRPAEEASPGARKTSITPLLQGAGVAVLLALALLTYFLMHRSKPVPIRHRIQGEWVLPDVRPGNNLSRLVIQPQDGMSDTARMTMHAWGACQPDPCDWGGMPTTIDDQSATSTFTMPDKAETRVATVIVRPTASGLDVLVQNTFTGNGPARNTQTHHTFVASH